MVRFSVVIPLYNKDPYIERALRSVLNQTIQDLEIIVVNDGSTDMGAQIVKSISNSKIRLINQENKGVSATRNKGINEAKSELIAFLDADDEWIPNYLETIYKLRLKYPCAGLYATSAKNEFIDNILLELDEESRNLIPREGLLLNYFKIIKTGHGIFGTSSVTIPKKVFIDIGAFQTGFWWGEDVDMWGRIALKYPIAYNSLVGSIYHINVVNSATEKRKPVEAHPFVRTATEALKNGQIPKGIQQDLEEYIKFLEMFTAKHNIKAGDKTLAFNLLVRSDIKLSYKKKLLRIMLSTYVRNNFPIFFK